MTDDGHSGDRPEGLLGRKPVRLILDNGMTFDGRAFGYDSGAVGEVVFTTGMVGYPESLTDPSYQGQLLSFTFPLIGNYGVPGNDREVGLLKNFESDRIHAKAVIVQEYAETYSHWNAVKSLEAWLVEQCVPGICDIDTRALTTVLREYGSMMGAIVPQGTTSPPDMDDPNQTDLVAEVSTWSLIEYGSGDRTVLLLDCGVKNNIIRAFVERGIRVVRAPWDYDPIPGIESGEYNGILLSNGPGDPKRCAPTIEHTRQAMARNVPILGICLGSQILALAAGADTYKLPYGHRSHNQPCLESGSRRCYVTSQNHGYAVEGSTLPVDWREWFVNNNDDTNEGLIHISRPFFGSQFHPEASPGPDDTEFIFDMFGRAMR